MNDAGTSAGRSLNCSSTTSRGRGPTTGVTGLSNPVVMGGSGLDIVEPPDPESGVVRSTIAAAAVTVKHRDTRNAKGLPMNALRVPSPYGTTSHHGYLIAAGKQ
jgi:hypothetical protein